MHLYCIARGHYTWLQEWIHRLQSQYYPHKYDPKKPPGLVQLAVRPWWPMEIVFPEQFRDQVLGMVQPYDGGNTKRKGGFGWQGRFVNSALGLSRIAGLEKIPDVPVNDGYRIVNPHGYVGVIGVGLKKDIHHHKTGIEML